MLRIFDDIPHRRNGPISRREWLRVGGTSLGALSLPLLASAAETSPASASSGRSNGVRKAKSIIVIFLNGGPPQHDSWDPKPEAPAEIRGGFGTIESATPGLRVGELMPLTARLTDKMAVLRAMVTNDNAHSSSGYQMMTGVPHVPLSAENVVSKEPNLAPHWGAVTRYVKRNDRQLLPPAITLPRHIANVGEIVWPGQSGGFLGPNYDPWLLDCDPSQAEFKVPDLALPEELPPLRFERRLTLLEQFDRHREQLARTSAPSTFSRHTQQALDLLGGSSARRAFDLTEESQATRDRYGRCRWAQSVLLARRLVEAGVSLVQVNWCRIENEENNGGWDTHKSHDDCLKRNLMPRMDQAFSALMTDLSERGLLDETLVVWAGEFGHTPKFNVNAGRDHWGQCFSIALAGGGVRGGTVYGKSDGHAAYPVSGRVEPRDLMATMFHCLGYSPDTEMIDTQGRPLPISRGRVINEIL